MNIIKYEIDTSGTCCPLPMISTLKVLQRIDTGEKIKVLATDHGFLDDVRSLERSRKCIVLETGQTDDYDFAILAKI